MTVEMPAGSVVITPTQMYGEIRDMKEQVQHLVNVVDPALTDIRSDIGDHERRLRSLEIKVWIAAGIATGAGAGLSKLGAILGGA